MSEHEDTYDQPINEPEPAEGPEPSPPAPVQVPVPPASATPGIYRYLGDAPTEHRRLGILVPGENDFSAVTHPEDLIAIRELVEADPPLLEKV
jgi:hypothetical protein